MVLNTEKVLRKMEVFLLDTTKQMRLFCQINNVLVTCTCATKVIYVYTDLFVFSYGINGSIMQLTLEVSVFPLALCHRFLAKTVGRECALNKNNLDRNRSYKNNYMQLMTRTSTKLWLFLSRTLSFEYNQTFVT